MFKKKSEKGFILFLTLMLMASMGAVGGALIVALSHDLREVSVESNNAKAFWLAEAGVADAIKRLRNNEINLISGQSDVTSILNVSLAGGTYSTTLSQSGNDITITSTGTYSAQSRRVQEIQTYSQTLPIAFNYGVFGNNSNGSTLKIGNNNAATVTISGDVFYKATPGVDTVQVNNASKVINGVIYADSITGGGTYTAGVGNPNPIPTYPAFASTSYDNAITADNSNTNLTLSGSSNLNLAGGTVNYKNVTIKNNATITGPGTIVANNVVSITDSAVIGSNVQIIANGNITIDTNAVVNSGGVYFSHTNVIVNDSANVTASLLAPGSGDDVRVQNTSTLTGVIYADTVKIANSAIVNGSVVAQQFTSNQIANSATINWNNSYLPVTVPAGFSGLEHYTHKANSWQET